MNPSNLEFVEITPASPIAIGWRHDNLISADIRNTIVEYLEPADEASRCFSTSRKANIAPFKIATRTFAWDDVCEWDDHLVSGQIQIDI